MGKNSTQDLLLALVKSLSEGPKSIGEIAEATGFDRTAITRYLEILKEGELLEEQEGAQQDGRKRIFCLKALPQMRRDTYFGLPLAPDQAKTIRTLYSLIAQIWKEATGAPIVQMNVHKSLFKINKIRKLNLPMGWYLHGPLCVMVFKPTETYENHGLEPQTLQCVREVVSEFAKESHAYKVKLKLYKEEGNNFYLLKEELLKLFYSEDFSKKHLPYLKKKLDEFTLLAPREGDPIYKEFLNEYSSLIYDLFTSLDDKSLKELKPEIVGSFDDFWRLLAIHQYRKNLADAHFYTPEILSAHFSWEILQRELELIESCSYLQSILPPLEEPADPAYLEFKAQLEKIRALPTLTEEEKLRNEGELARIEKEGGIEAVNKHLSKKFGLD